MRKAKVTRKAVYTVAVKADPNLIFEFKIKRDMESFVTQLIKRFPAVKFAVTLPKRA